MRFSSDSETSTPLPDPGRPGETSDRGTQTSRWAEASYIPGFDGSRGIYVFELAEEPDVDDRD